MFLVKSDKAIFEYDIHSLIKAFYPEEEVKLLTPASVIKDRTLLTAPAAMRLGFGEEEVVFETLLNGAHVYSWKSEGKEGPEYKNAFKRFLYKALSEETGTVLPWGNLTGIRPTKIATAMLGQGKEGGEIIDFLKTEHMVSADKAALSVEIASRERELLGRLNHENGYSLYIGIPFCPTTCLYCSFTSFPIALWKDRVGEYLSALEKEIDFAAEIYKDKVLETIYIGGGTPTSLSAAQLERLLGKINEAFDLSQLKEFTVEAGRADSIDEEKLNALKNGGVTRISVNPQTMNEETLKLIGRRHTPRQVVNAFYMAREAGFDNINMDIILGLPGESEEAVKNTVNAIKELAPDSLTVHSLAVKRAAAMQGWIAEHGLSGLHNTDEIMETASRGARSMGMAPYYLYRQKNMAGNFENVGYAAEGKYGIYNILIIEEVQDILALGAGCVSKRVYGDGRIERCDSVKDVGLYIERIDEMIERKRVLFMTKELE